MADDHSVRQLIEELSNAALRDLLRNVRHHTELRRRIAAGTMDERWVNQLYREYARRAGPSYRQRASDLTLQYYTDLTALGNEYSERFYEEVLDGAARFDVVDGRARWADGNGDVANTASTPTEEIPIELHGPPGREVVARFAVENTEAHEVTVTIDVGVCRGPHDESFHAPLTVQPAVLTLQPGESRRITLRLLMLPAVFVPGHLYRLPVTVRGGNELRLVLSIWAEEPDTGLRLDPTDARAAADAPVAGAAPEPPPPQSSAVPNASVNEDRGEGTTPRTATPVRRAGRAREHRPAEFIVRCPACHREFARRERTSRLYPHNGADGRPCPERHGRARSA